jgi:hypothetical protein
VDPSGRGRYPSQMHAPIECYPRDGSRPTLHTHVQPPACGFGVVTDEAKAVCPSHVCKSRVTLLARKPSVHCPGGAHTHTHTHAVASHAGSRRAQDVLRRPLRRSFPPASRAMSFSSKDSRRQARLSGNSKCHGSANYALTDQPVWLFESREPPLARCPLF